MRGKLGDFPFPLTSIRITPAGAGKTRQQKTAPPAGQDHPRRCGENEAADDVLHRMQGSPPQVRGKLYVAFLAHYKSRITPAGAGKTANNSTQNINHEDHPRRCGENEIPQPVYTIKPGSPPQVRGKPAQAG